MAPEHSVEVQAQYTVGLQDIRQAGRAGAHQDTLPWPWGPAPTSWSELCRPFCPVGPRARLGERPLRPSHRLQDTGHGAPSLGCSRQAGTGGVLWDKVSDLGGELAGALVGQAVCAQGHWGAPAHHGPRPPLLCCTPGHPLFPWRSPWAVALRFGKAFHCPWTFTFEGLVYTVLGSLKKKKKAQGEKMLTSGLKILPAANPGVRSLLVGNERRGACKQGAIGEGPPGPRGAGAPAQQVRLQRLAVCSYSSPGGPGPLSCGRTSCPPPPLHENLPLAWARSRTLPSLPRLLSLRQLAESGGSTAGRVCGR